mmetsp:Transcript_18757/g.20904  ORF Transcript_18757/g.20904 Transcript_18757/m.20904 type:complete len:168 (-) Transcript_18757:159-662(-)
MYSFSTSSVILLAFLILIVVVEGGGSSFQDKCTIKISNIPNGKLNSETYANLMSYLSDGLASSTFERLPLQLTALYNLQACANDRPCIRGESSIPTATTEGCQKTCQYLEKIMSLSKILPPLSTNEDYKDEQNIVCEDAKGGEVEICLNDYTRQENQTYDTNFHISI